MFCQDKCLSNLLENFVPSKNTPNKNYTHIFIEKITSSAICEENNTFVTKTEHPTITDKFMKRVLLLLHINNISSWFMD